MNKFFLGTGNANGTVLIYFRVLLNHQEGDSFTYYTFQNVSTTDTNWCEG